MVVYHGTMGKQSTLKKSKYTSPMDPMGCGAEVGVFFGDLTCVFSSLPSLSYVASWLVYYPRFV